MMGLLIPPWAKWLALALLVAAIWGHGWVRGNAHGTAKLGAYIGKQAEQAAIVRGKRAAVTERVVTEYVKVAGKTRTVTETVEKEVIRYVATNPDGMCIDPEWVRLHNLAAGNRVPDHGRKPDATVPATRGPARQTDRGADPSDGHLELRSASSLR